MRNKPFISIVLPTYNRLEPLKRFILPSLNFQNYNCFELIVVDDHSDDGTSEFFNSSQFAKQFSNLHKRTIFIGNLENKGVPASRMIGVWKAKGNWIFMVEDDLSIPTKSFLSKAEEYILRYGSLYKIIAPMRLETSNAHYDNCFNGYSKMGLFSKEVYLNPKFTETENNSVQAHSCVFIEKSVFNHVNYINIKGLSFREESDFYSKATKIGIKILYLGNLLVSEHYGNQVKSGGTRLNGKSFFTIQSEYLRDHYIFLLNNYTYPKIRLVLYIPIWFINQFASKYKLIEVKRILAKLAI